MHTTPMKDTCPLTNAASNSPPSRQRVSGVVKNDAGHQLLDKETVRVVGDRLGIQDGERTRQNRFIVRCEQKVISVTSQCYVDKNVQRYRRHQEGDRHATGGHLDLDRRELDWILEMKEFASTAIHTPEDLADDSAAVLASDFFFYYFGTTR